MGTKRARTQPITADLQKVLQCRGLFTRVARQLDLTSQHVSRVARGQRQSQRVLRALLAELQRIERRAA